MSDVLAFLEGNESEEDINQARETLYLLQQKIAEIKPRQMNLNPINNEISFPGTTIKWKLSPKPFKILGRMFGIIKGDLGEAIAETPFRINLEYKVDGAVTLFAEVGGEIGHFLNPQDDGDMNFHFGATLRF